MQQQQASKLEMNICNKILKFIHKRWGTYNTHLQLIEAFHLAHKHTFQRSYN